MVNLRNGLDKLKPYSIDEAVWRIKNDANEMPCGFSGSVQKIAQEALAGVELNRYPEIAAKELRGILAGDLGVSIENVQVGNGSSELLGAMCHAFGGSGRRIVFPTPSFSMYGVYAQLSDSEPVPVQLTEDFQVPAGLIVETVKKSEASLLILCNPNNPTGTVMPLADIEQIAANVECPVVVDEAYYEFYGQTAMPLLKKYPNLMIIRTFSKAYGLAAARVGYLIADREIAAAVGKVLLPYHVNALSLAVASAIYRNKNQALAVVQGVIRERERLAAVLKEIDGFTVYKSDTNFLLVKTEEASGIASCLTSQGIGIRDFSKSPGLTGCLRLTVGTNEENNEIIRAIKNYFLK